MSLSKCLKCGKSIFQVEALNPIGYNESVLTLICHSCNSVNGTINTSSNNHSNNDIEFQLKSVNQKLETINTNLSTVINGLKFLYSKVEKSD